MLKFGKEKSKNLEKQIKKQRIRTPTVLQMEEVECGAAALGIILSYYGRFVPLAELRTECGVSRDGSQPASIVKAARNYGLRAKAFKKQTAQLSQMRLPVIVFWNFNHLLVVEGFDKDKVYLNDPATGPRAVSLQEFEQSYIGIVLVMEPEAGFKKGGRKPSVLMSLLERLNGSVGAVVLSVMIGFLLVLPGMALPVFNQVFVDQILVERRSDWLRPLLLGMSGTAAVQGFLFFLQRRYLRQLQVKLAASMSSRFLWHMLQLPVSFYTQRFPGEISSRLKLNDKVAQVLSGSMANTFINLIMAAFYGLVMFAYNWMLTTIGVLFAVLNMLILQWVERWREDNFMQSDKDWGKAEGVAIAGIQSIETLKASALESDMFARWAGYISKSWNAFTEIAVINEMLFVLPILLTGLTTMLIFAVGGWQVMDGKMTIGMLIAFQSLMTSFQEPVNQLMGFGAMLQTLSGNLMRLDDVLANSTDSQLGVKSEELGVKSDLVRFQGHIELRNITFGYAKVSQPLVENFSCVIKPGQRIAFVGGSGSGKSTIAKLVAGLYEPWSGDILFDGRRRQDIPRAVLVNSISTVEQEIFLFAGTVRDNLTLWDSSIPDSQIRRACVDARIQDVILALPGGYSGSLLEGGANLSGGQRQRLEIARSLINNPSILILDEATSALDGETEQIIYDNLRSRGCSCLIVAHRLSSIRDCDEIIVLDKGIVVQRGTHEELMLQGGFYAELVRGEEEAEDE
ncbi:ABC transporter ATP-binding protein [Calothrix sp. NIES-4071]|nr:ABC transporter ATP-binding protein [Calothrix sp. NIES-4071]BAZ55103.1 ABC transporter ATP-binding protein [Calothrix sp. NIES-4105]